MKQVDPKKYGAYYYDRRKRDRMAMKKSGFKRFIEAHEVLSSLVDLSKDQIVVDFGCGTGELSYCLNVKYGCTVIGIDYSQDAIDVAKEDLKDYEKVIGHKSKLSFLCRNNDALPKLEDISCVYFSDVFEHMYDYEIKHVLGEIAKWNSSRKPTILLHTDNNIYLKFVHPLLNSLFVILGKQTLFDVRKAREWASERHVNLTHPRKLNRKMAKWGYKQQVLLYPLPKEQLVKKQLGASYKIPGFAKFCILVLKRFKFLTPSFYGVYVDNSL